MGFFFLPPPPCYFASLVPTKEKNVEIFNSWGARNQTVFPCGMWAGLRPLIQGPDAALERVLDNVVPASARGYMQLGIDTVTDAALG